MFGKRGEIRASTQEVKTLIGVGCQFEGNLTLSEGITRIDGDVIGNINGGGSIIIGEKGSVKGNISLVNVIVYGRVEGDISAKSVELRSGSYTKGNINTMELVVEKGAIYNGECKMEEKGVEPPTL